MILPTGKDYTILMMRSQVNWDFISHSINEYLWCNLSYNIQIQKMIDIWFAGIKSRNRRTGVNDENMTMKLAEMYIIRNCLVIVIIM